MKNSIYILSILILSVLVFSCGKNSKLDCEENNTGTILIHNDGTFMPDVTADFYHGSTKIASLAKGQTATVDNLPAGSFIMTAKDGADTIYSFSSEPDTILQCQTLHYYTSEEYIPVSDKILKKNILPVNNVLINLAKLNIYTYEYNAPKNYAGFLPKGIHYGFMAQELKNVYPTFVILNSNGYYSVNYQEMIPILAKGIQEQQTQIDDLKKEISELKSMVKQQQTLTSK